MTRRAAAGVMAVAVVGGVATMAVSMAYNMPGADALRLAGLAGGAAAAAALVGTTLLFALRRRSIGLQVTIVALTALVAVAAGALAAADAMFLSHHDLDLLLVILLASGTIGALVAMVLGWRVSAAAGSLSLITRRIGRGDLQARPAAPAVGEFGSVARELEAMAGRLAEARDRERALDASRRELTAWVSHDLRTPLSGIQAILEALEDGLAEDPATLARYHRTLRVEADRLAHLIDELFELSVIDAGALNLQLSRVSWGDLVSDAIAGASAAAGTRGVRVRGQLLGPGAELELSASEMSRVLRNLLDNAIRHTPADGSVWVEAGVEPKGAYVSVADECGGIPEPDLPRVFEPAFRGERARTPGPDGGAGLGLAIARGLVEAHHGHISVRNEGSGCRFTVRLPISQPG